MWDVGPYHLEEGPVQRAVADAVERHATGEAVAELPERQERLVPAGSRGEHGQRDRDPGVAGEELAVGLAGQLAGLVVAEQLRLRVAAC